MKKFTHLKKILLLLALTFAFSLQGQYLVNFEGEGEIKPAYASGTVNLSGLDWDMTEALIGNLEADFKFGERSARLRGYAASSMTMLESKPNGLGEISFYYRRYGTDAQVDWKVEYSVNQGTSWIQVGDNFTAPASDVVQQFVAAVNVDGNVSIRIKRATEDGTANRRLNIDDILLTDFGDTPTVAIPVIMPGTGTYFNPITVEITTATEGATIYYTTDGDDPDQSSTTYTGAIAISSNTTLKAKAYAPDHNPSIIATAVYTFVEPSFTDLPYSESFDDGLGKCYVHSVSGDTKKWVWNTNEWAQMNGHNSGDVEIDWLILPGIDFGNYLFGTMIFESWYRFGEDDDENYLKLYYSLNYPGVGNPADYAWTELPFARPTAEETWASSGTIDLSDVSREQVFIGFKYQYNPGTYRWWQIDELFVNGEPVGLNQLDATAFNVYPNPAKDVVYVETKVSAELSVLDMAGRIVHHEKIGSGSSRIGVSHLQAGTYVLRLELQSGDIQYSRVQIK